MSLPGSDAPGGLVTKCHPSSAPPTLTACPLRLAVRSPGMRRALEGRGANYHENDTVQLC